MPHCNKGSVLDNLFAVWADLVLFESFLNHSQYHDQRKDFEDKLVLVSPFSILNMILALIFLRRKLRLSR